MALPAEKVERGFVLDVSGVSSSKKESSVAATVVCRVGKAVRSKNVSHGAAGDERGQLHGGEVIQRAGPPGYWRSRGLHGQRDRIGEEPALSSSRIGIDTAATFALVALGLGASYL